MTSTPLMATPAGPRVAWSVGLGCDRGTPADTLGQALALALAQVGATPGDVAAAGSITLKADEAGLLELARRHGWALRFYPPEQLAPVPVPHPSETVRKYTGTPSVSEAAALLGAGLDGVPAGIDHLVVDKLKHRGEDGRHATVSLARIDPPASPGARRFSAQEAAVLHEVLQARRDMRHFTPGCTVDAATRERLLRAAEAAPSVGLMQPWRFIRIRDAALRLRLAGLVEAERQRTAAALGERGAEFMALKVEGLRECAELWAVVLAPDDGTVFGRRTMAREMAWCSAAAAVQNLWLAARAENLGLGWVSLFEPAALAEALQLPAGAEPLGLLCIGPVDHFYDRPMLVQQGWREARAPLSSLCEDRWQFDARHPFLFPVPSTRRAAPFDPKEST